MDSVLINQLCDRLGVPRGKLRTSFVLLRCPSVHQRDDAAAVAATLVDSGSLRVTRRIIAEVSLRRPQGQIDPSPPEEEEEEGDEEEGGGGREA